MITWNDTAVKAAIKASVENASEKGATMVYRAAKGSTDFKNDTGTLRKSIKKTKSKFPNGGWIVYADAPHAPLVELGCRGGAQPPKPFMRNAKKSKEDVVKRLFATELAKI